MKIKLYALLIVHEYGESVYLYRSARERRAELYKYVKEWWTEVSEKACPRSMKRAISEYFQAKDGREWYHTSDHVVEVECLSQ